MLHCITGLYGGKPNLREAAIIQRMSRSEVNRVGPTHKWLECKLDFSFSYLVHRGNYNALSCTALSFPVGLGQLFRRVMVMSVSAGELFEIVRESPRHIRRVGRYASAN